jgi:hypothetical protein
MLLALALADIGTSPPGLRGCSPRGYVEVHSENPRFVPMKDGVLPDTMRA